MKKFENAYNNTWEKYEIVSQTMLFWTRNYNRKDQAIYDLKNSNIEGYRFGYFHKLKTLHPSPLLSSAVLLDFGI